MVSLCFCFSCDVCTVFLQIPHLWDLVSLRLKIKEAIYGFLGVFIFVFCSKISSICLFLDKSQERSVRTCTISLSYSLIAYGRRRQTWN